MPVQPGDDHGPPPRPTTARRLTADERRRQLVDVALRQFADRGYEAATMDDIAEAAGVTKPLLYQHFASKRALYLELVHAVAEDLLAAVRRATASADGPRRQVEDGLAAFFNTVSAQETAFRLLYMRTAGDDEELGGALRRVEDALAEAIDPLIAAGLDDAHRRFLAAAVVGMAEGASRQWLAARAAGTDGISAPVLARRLADLAWAGLRSVHRD